MGCSTTNWDFVQDVWSKGSTSTPAFIPLLRLPTNEAARVKLAYQLRGASNLEIRRAWRFSNDGVTWGTPIEYGPDYTSNGWSWGKSYVAVHDDYQWVEVGVNAQNTSGTEMESGEVRAIVATREDPLADFGDAPSSWGSLDTGCLRVASDKFRVYDTSSPPYAYTDVYDTPGAAWSLAVVGATQDLPSGPCAWGGAPYWIGYDQTTRLWGVYKDTSTYAGSISLVGGTTLAGGEHAIARVSVDGTGAATATFEVSFDGLTWHTLYMLNTTWYWRAIIIRAGATYTVQREVVV